MKNLVTVENQIKFKSSSIGELNSLRGLAALIVFISHFSGMRIGGASPIACGQHGVLIFFVLSGFLMGFLYNDKFSVEQSIPKSAIGTTISYLVKRFFRIIPLYYFIIIASYLISLYFNTSYISPYNVAGKLKSLLALKSDYLMFWTIAIEFKFYFLLPVIIILINKLSNNQIELRVLILSLLTIYFCLNLQFDQNNRLNLFNYIIPFLAGIISADLLKILHLKSFNIKPFANIGFCLSLVLLIVTFPALINKLIGTNFLIWYYQPLMSILASIMIILSLNTTGIVNLCFNNKFFRFIGDVSFSFYLVHLLVINSILKVGFISKSYFWLPLIMLAVSLFISYICYILVEKPFMNLGKVILKRNA